VLVRKQLSTTTFEIFEVQAPNESVMSTPGKLVRPYPGPAIEVPNTTANDIGFIEEISSFLAQMSRDILKGSTAKTTKAGSEVAEVRDSADPHYISQLFTGILRGMGREVEPRRVVKRIADEVLWDNTYKPWRRSPLWLIIRVALQTSLTSVEDYKNLMVFFHARVLSICQEQPSFPSDLLFSMRVKMAQRLYKIQDSVQEFVSGAVKDAADLTESVLQGRWDKVQAEVPKLRPLDLPIAQSLPNSREYLERVIKGRSSDRNDDKFEPHHPARLSNVRNFTDFAEGALSGAFDVDKHVALYDFEASVHENLTKWTDENLGNESACAVVSSCLNQYTEAAFAHYIYDAADRSVMILTIMQLWVALDRIATELHPILCRYSPEIAEHLVESLLLRSLQHIEQANMIQSHLRRRHAEAESTTRDSVFIDQATKNSLAIDFFRQSPSMQELKQTIEKHAKQKREEKLEEIRRQNQEHARIVQCTGRLTHEYSETRKTRDHDEHSCEKCQGEREARDMRIDVFEWPLPRDRLEAERVIFELQCPEAINIWRSITYKIVCDIGGIERAETINPHCTLAGYGGLVQWSSQLRSSNHRITIASSTKSFLRSHYSSTSLPTHESAVCVNNGLTFRLFDSSTEVWAAAPFTGTSFVKYGTLALPLGSPYRYLSYALEETTHTSNRVLADQFHCPKDLSLHEHYAFGTLRSGPLLQWTNIIRGLEENILTFHREEVDLLLTQAAWQVGRLSDDGLVRDWHLDLCVASYGQLLVTKCRCALNRVEANWLEGTSVKILGMFLDNIVVLGMLTCGVSNACSAPGRIDNGSFYPTGCI
jgi:hypothetical protein